VSVSVIDRPFARKRDINERDTGVTGHDVRLRIPTTVVAAVVTLAPLSRP